VLSNSIKFKQKYILLLYYHLKYVENYKGWTNCIDWTKYSQEAIKLEINTVKFTRKKHHMSTENFKVPNKNKKVEKIACIIPSIQ
jgi:hypothetical protein